MKKALLLTAALCMLFACGAGRVLADDVEWTVTFTDLQPKVIEHPDQEPFKGSASVIVTNDTNEYWTDFHFQIFSVNGSNITQTIFVDGGAYNPISTQNGMTWTINNDPNGATMNLYFASDPVAPGSTALFKVYTDNTAFKQRFGLSCYPTVPEPSSILAFASGLIGLAGLALRKRS